MHISRKSTAILCILSLALASGVGMLSCKKGPKGVSPTAPSVPFVVPRIVDTLPHDSAAFTQGLFLAGGRLYESTGLYGKSSMRAIDTSTGVVLTNLPVAPGAFAEGCALLNNEIAQITWKERTAIVYSFPDLAPLRTLSYEGEGWGLTSDGSSFFMSNGSDTLFKRDAAFKTVRAVPVRFAGQPLPHLNELEYVNGHVYANVWYSNYIFEIDPESGIVTRVLDCADLVQKEQPPTADYVLNGIAYNGANGRFYLTGKNWKHIYIVEIPQ
jgi:glutaminyl-peptide cyclotransferase